MSYWNDCEKQPGAYDFTELDQQITLISKKGGQISLCLGVRQPRWPENHWPEWAWQLPSQERSAPLLKFIQTVVERYHNNPAIISYQLENEALLANFGRRPDIDIQRLKSEYKLVKQLDPIKPIIMTTSTSWGIPIRQPIPDVVGFSFYHTLYQNGRYKHSLLYPWVHRLRAKVIAMLHRKPVFIHELQLEPWGPTAIWKMSNAEQDKSMSTEAITRNLQLAEKIRRYPIDMWGAEWWYWRHKQGDDSIWQAVRHHWRDSS